MNPVVVHPLKSLDGSALLEIGSIGQVKRLIQALTEILGEANRVAGRLDGKVGNGNCGGSDAINCCLKIPVKFATKTVHEGTAIKQTDKVIVGCCLSQWDAYNSQLLAIEIPRRGTFPLQRLRVKLPKETTVKCGVD